MPHPTRQAIARWAVSGLLSVLGILLYLYLERRFGIDPDVMAFFLVLGLGALSMVWGVFRLIVPDRKSTRLNSSHVVISYAVFCLKKKNV